MPRDSLPTMRILHCLRAPVGGLFRHVLDVAAEQARRGHDVGILADATTGDRLTEPRLAALGPALTLGITRIAMSRNPGPGDLACVRKTAALAREKGIHILHGHGAKGGAYARLARRTLIASGTPVAAFYTPHGGSLNFRPGTLEARVFIGLEKVLDRLTDGLVFESAYAARVYAERVGVSQTARRVIPNGLRPEDFFERQLAADPADFVFIGELRDVKGIDTLIDALGTIRRQRPVRAVIVGSGPQGDVLKQRAAALGLADDVSFPGAMPARDAFCLGRCLVVPSRAESFPYVVLEGAAAGLPIISTNVGGIPEMVQGTDTPLIVPDNVGVLATAMREFLEDPAGMAGRAARFKSVVGERYTVANMTSAILDFYATQSAFTHT